MLTMSCLKRIETWQAKRWIGQEASRKHGAVDKQNFTKVNPVGYTRITVAFPSQGSNKTPDASKQARNEETNQAQKCVPTRACSNVLFHSHIIHVFGNATDQITVIKKGNKKGES